MRARDLFVAVVVGAAVTGTGLCAAADSTNAALGRALYQGERAWSEAPRLPSGVSLPPHAAACASCHGVRGEGKREGGAVVPALRARDAQAMVQAAIDGRAADGRVLAAPMPRYALGTDEAQALRAYLERVGSDDGDPVAGVDARAVRWVTLVPRRSAPGAADAADHAARAMRARFARRNTAGGAYGRELRLEVIEFEPGATRLPDALMQVLEAREVFGVIGSFVGDVPDTWSRELERRSIPMLANLLPTSTGAATPWITHLVPSLHAQATQAAAQLAQRCGGEPTWIVKPAARYDDITAALHVPHDRVLLEDAAPPLQARCVFSLLPPASHTRLRAALQSRQGPRAAAALASVAMVSGPLDITQDGSVTHARTPLVEVSIAPKLPALGNAANAENRSVWATLGDLAARIAIEAMARSGHDLHPAALRRAVESMTGYEALPGVALQYSPQQRAGLALASHWSHSP